MKRFILLAILRAAICTIVAATSATIINAAMEEDRAVLQADGAFIQALKKADKPSLARLLDREFTWIDSNGKSLSRAQLLEDLPPPANADVDAQEHTYGSSAVVRANRGKVQVMRIWARRAAGWRAVLYQEVTQVEKSEPPPAAEAESNECENPCKTVPFHPDTESEREAIISWQGVMRAMANNDADAYAPLIADEFTATDTHHDRPYNKADRLSQINKQKLAGARSVPPALVSARMFDFGDTVMMIAREQRANAKAKAYFNTRMWVKREGRWQMLFSFNTRIE
jgi:hypothetical protein